MVRNIIYVIEREAATAAAFSLQSLGMCLSFQDEKMLKRCLTRDTYFSIWGSCNSYSLFTCSTTNRESLQIRSFSTDIVAASSILARMTSYYDSLLEALKPKRIACSTFSPVEYLSCKPMPAPVFRDAPSTLRTHWFKLSRLILDWGDLC